jgi:DNA primase
VQLEMLKKFTQRVILMLDADEAGKGATERSFEVQHRIGLEVLVAPLPAARDPADVVAEDGVDAIHKFIDGAQPLLAFVLEARIARLPLDTPEARAKAVREVAEVLGWHPDAIARHDYAFSAAQRIGVAPEAIHRALSEAGNRARGARVDGDGRQERRLPGHVKVEREALQLLLTQPNETVPWAAEVLEQDFTAPARREVFRHATDEVAAGRAPVASKVAERLSSDGLALLTELAVGEEVAADDLAARAQEVFVRLKVFAIERQIRGRRNVLQDVNPVDEPDRHDELFTELVGLEAQRRDLLRRLQGV